MNSRAMKSLDQIRATNALKDAPKIASGKEGGDAISGFPALIRVNGLLAALAFAVEKRPSDEVRRIVEPLLQHLGETRQSEQAALVSSDSVEGLLVEVFGMEPAALQQVTTASRDFVNHLPAAANSRFRRALAQEGLLFALAGALKKNAGAYTIAQSLAVHLSMVGIEVATSVDADALVGELASWPDDSKLRRATAEAMAYLPYLKRFVP